MHLSMLITATENLHRNNEQSLIIATICIKSKTYEYYVSAQKSKKISGGIDLNAVV